MSGSSAQTRRHAVPAELEVCVDSEYGLSVCERAGVDRIELCAALALGGLTPSHGFMVRAAAALCASQGRDPSLQMPQVYAMIRPRAGDFCFTGAELRVMCDDIQRAQQAGLAGVVLGAATSDGRLDQAALARMCQAAGGMGKTLHRVIDMLADPLEAVDQAVSLGFDRILTSGGARQVADGLVRLQQMQLHAGQRIQIMAGAGLSPSLAGKIRSQIGIESFHSSCTRGGDVNDDYQAFGFAPAAAQLDHSLILEYQHVLAAP